MTRAVRKYTNEFKQEAIKLALKLPSVEQAVKELGIPGATVHGWIHASKKQGTFKRPDCSNSSTSRVEELMKENRQLHKKLGIVEEEREILKKAAAYFAQHQK